MAQVESVSSLESLDAWYDPADWFSDDAATIMKKKIESTPGQTAVQLTKEEATGPSYKGPTASDYATESKKKIQADLAAKAADKSTTSSTLPVAPELETPSTFDWKKILLISSGAALILAGVVLFLKQRKLK